ncbi:MAG: hypothetical protein ACREDU_00155, partial [Methylocella sp.]
MTLARANLTIDRLFECLVQVSGGIEIAIVIGRAPGGICIAHIAPAGIASGMQRSAAAAFEMQSNAK